MNTLLAVPSNNPGGLQATIAQHFGHCDLYTLIDIKDGDIERVYTIPNVPHEQGGCMAPVQYLANKGVKHMISGGMGFRPLMGFEQVGIKVFHFGNSLTIKEGCDSFIKGELSEFSKEQTCGGGNSL